VGAGNVAEERFVGMPEQRGRFMISADPLLPGIYTASGGPDGTA
jgi:ATP-dependent Lon protease